MKRSRMRAAAISWTIAGGLLCGGFTALGTPSATADSGGAHDNDSDPGAAAPATGGLQSRDAGKPTRPRSRESIPTAGGTGDPSRDAGLRAAADVPTGPDEPPLPLPLPWPFDDPFPFPFPFPWPTCTVIDDCVALPAPASGSVQTAPPPQSPAGDSDGVRGLPPLSPAFPGHPTQPGDPGVVNADGGAVVSGDSGTSPLHLPPIMGGPTSFGGAAAVEAPAVRGPSSTSASNTGTGPRDMARSGEGSTRERLPGGAGSGTSEVPASFRVGYPQYLREAKIGEVAVFALPGILGILALTTLGGVVGYRQAKASHVGRAAGTARFLR